VTTAESTLTCLEVRDLLPELALGMLPREERRRVERHLAWCAGCRKESSELGAAAATFAFTLRPAPMPEALRTTVVEEVKRAAGASGSRRRSSRAVGAAIVAGFIALASLGWGAAMAGRAARFEDRAAAVDRRSAAAFDRMKVILNQLVPGAASSNETHLAQLTPTAAGSGGAFALQLVSPRLIDFALVMVNGIDPATAADELPYRVQLLNAAGDVLRVGAITSLDAEGGADVYRQFDAIDLTGYTTVRVLDADGVVVLRGTIDQNG
jgi:putative zinc finger protein